MLRIGLTQRVEIVPERHERRDGLDQAWTRLLVENEYRPVPLPNGVSDVDEYLADLELNGVILTGGNDLGHLPDATNPAPERDVFEQKLLRYCGHHKTPVVGVCRGLQMLVTYYGGSVTRIANHVGIRHELVIAPSRAMSLDHGRKVNSYHEFGVFARELPPVFELVAAAPDGSAEAIAHRRLPQWGIMWHPEREDPFQPSDVELLNAIFRKGRS